jgi:septal ring-binding cell division protein DamX
MRSRCIEGFSLAAPVLVLVVALAACGGGDEEPVVEETPPREATQPAQEQAITPQQPAQEPAVQPPPSPRVIREPDTSPYGFYTIQLSSWSTRSKAESQAGHYREMGLEAYVQEAQIPGMGTWYRVRVGNYPSLSEAREAAAALFGVEELWVDNFQEIIPPR